MKKPKQPVRPHKPVEPSKPQKFLKPEKCSRSIYTGTSLAEIIRATEGVDPEKVYFDATCGYYDEYDYQFEWEDVSERLNPRYERDLDSYQKKMIKYQKDMEKHSKEMIVYSSNLKEYNSINKQYMKWFHENELKKLG